MPCEPWHRPMSGVVCNHLQHIRAPMPRILSALCGVDVSNPVLALKSSVYLCLTVILRLQLKYFLSCCRLMIVTLHLMQGNGLIPADMDTFDFLCATMGCLNLHLTAKAQAIKLCPMQVNRGLRDVPHVTLYYGCASRHSEPGILHHNVIQTGVELRGPTRTLSTCSLRLATWL
ncbi:unnamed protein product [Symbiodinium pilosum]|uniref:Uncharacterized protein n=1 Tax=Symbiodinium pilosum TaxID=2952 RepID=A0A812V9W0_SYMPI|nr:unnamed protein product [Symbiodinium pilosum]